MNAFPDAVAAVRRSSQVYHAQIAHQTPLACGMALTCHTWPSLPQGNQLREVFIGPDQSVRSCFEEVQSHYQKKGLQCYRWSPAAGQSAEQIEPVLTAHGYRTVLKEAWHQTRHPAVVVGEHFRILPARAMRGPLRALVLGHPAYPPAVNQQRMEAVVQRLDSPNYDLFVAMLEGRPAGMGALLQAGDIGRITDLYVAEPYRRKGLGQGLLAHLSALSRRLALRITCIELDSTAASAKGLCRRCGFEAGGSFIEFVRSATNGEPCEE